MILRPGSIIWLTFALVLVCAGCGLFYQAGSRVKADRMKDSLKPGETTLQVHEKWGEPDLRNESDARTQIWSYVEHPNSNDVTATLLYTSTKPGDTGKFLDLKFVDGNLVSWNDATHTVPSKQGAGFSYGFGPTGGSAPVSHY
jgi:outer membrane protein assembly factor BamE (lipoprotein component of BamABCDE complex)